MPKPWGFQWEYPYQWGDYSKICYWDIPKTSYKEILGFPLGFKGLVREEPQEFEEKILKSSRDDPHNQITRPSVWTIVLTFKDTQILEKIAEDLFTSSMMWSTDLLEEVLKTSSRKSSDLGKDHTFYEAISGISRGGFLRLQVEDPQIFQRRSSDFISEFFKEMTPEW